MCWVMGGQGRRRYHPHSEEVWGLAEEAELGAGRQQGSPAAVVQQRLGWGQGQGQGGGHPSPSFGLGQIIQPSCSSVLTSARWEQ